MDSFETRQTNLLDEPTDAADDGRVSTESTGTSEVKRQSKGKRKPKKVIAAKGKKAEKAIVSQSKASGKTAIISVVPGIWKSETMPSGAKYVWSGPGAQVLVANEDVDSIMSRNSNKARECCGSGGRIYFQIVEE
ncbi:MAG: hypothetical protein K940chlam2_00007 [Chlamydiae bacterium]|nr:hypothetical protein [Chlamydiota bacterium]